MSSIESFDFGKLEYTILPGNPPRDFLHQELHDRMYKYWWDFWYQIYGSSEGVDGDTFLRQNFIPVVTFKHEIVAIHLYTVFNPKALATKDHSYFHTYPKEFFSYLEQKGASSVMSIESLTVNPDWRKSRVGISFGEIMIGCSLKYLEALSIDAVIAPTRNDRGVNKMCYNFGFDCYAANLDYRGFDIDLVCGFKRRVSNNPNEKINNIINELWESRIDLTGLIGDKTSERGRHGELKEIAI